MNCFPWETPWRVAGRGSPANSLPPEAMCQSVRWSFEVMLEVPSAAFSKPSIFCRSCLPHSRSSRLRIVEALPHLYVRRWMASEPAQPARSEGDPLFSDHYVDQSAVWQLARAMANATFDELRPHLVALLGGSALGVSAVSYMGAEEVAVKLALGHLDAVCRAPDTPGRRAASARAQEDLHPLLPRRGPFTSCAWRLGAPHFLVACAVARLIDAIAADEGEFGVQTAEVAHAVLAEAGSADGRSAPAWLRAPLSDRAQSIASRADTAS
jgi:hypothetical protein